LDVLLGVRHSFLKLPACASRLSFGIAAEAVHVRWQLLHLLVLLFIALECMPVCLFSNGNRLCSCCCMQAVLITGPLVYWRLRFILGVCNLFVVDFSFVPGQVTREHCVEMVN